MSGDRRSPEYPPRPFLWPLHNPLNRLVDLRTDAVLDVSSLQLSPEVLKLLPYLLRFFCLGNHLSLRSPAHHLGVPNVDPLGLGIRIAQALVGRGCAPGQIEEALPIRVLRSERTSLPSGHFLQAVQGAYVGPRDHPAHFDAEGGVSVLLGYALEELHRLCGGGPPPPPPGGPPPPGEGKITQGA